MVVWLALMACGPSREREEEKLRATYRDASARPIELRLAHFPYVPARVTRGTSSAVESELSAAAFSIISAPATAGSNVQTRAAAYLLADKSRQAVTYLESQLGKGSSATLWNDYAVALHAVARQENDPRSLAAALAAADRALVIAPTLAEAAFNRAAILDSLHLRAPAAAAWERYLTLDAGSGWQEEARRALQNDLRPTTRQRWDEIRPRLESAAVAGNVAEVDEILRKFPQQVRTWGETIYLTQWGEKWLAGKHDDARRGLRIATVLGDRLVAVSGKSLLHDAAAAIRNADAIHTATLARAHVQYSKARLLIRDRKPTEATAILESVASEFAAARSPMAQVARYYLAGTEFDARNAEAALRVLDSIEVQPKHHALRAQVLWERSRIRGRLGYLHDSLILALEATQILDHLGERDSAARNRLSAAAILHRLGRPDEGWRLRLGVLREASESGSPILLQAALSDLSRDEIAEGRPAVARSLLDVLLTLDQPSPLLHFDALLWHTFVRYRSGEAIDRDPTLAALRVSAESIQDEALRGDALDQLAFAEALLVAKENPPRAIRLLSSVIDFRFGANRRTGLADAYLQRARAHDHAGAADAAMHDLESVLKTLEEQRLEVNEADLRDSFFDAAAEACADLVSLQLKRGDDDAAFAAADRCRVRALLDVFTGPVARTPVTRMEVLSALPADAMAVHYTALPDRLVVWTFEKKRLGRVIVRVSKRNLETAGEKLRMALQGQGDVTAAARTLHEILIRPIARDLPRKLVVFADATVTAIPFGVLRGRMDEPYLIERCEILMAPSASTWSSSVRKFSPPAIANALIVGDPAFDPALSLPRLPAAAAEARAISRLYPRATILLDRDATAANFLTSAPPSDVIHLGTHALVSARDARDSAILFAASPGSTGVTTLARLSSTPLHRNPTVVLSGCSTGVFGGGRGAIRSLAYAFLVAGSRAAVASLWEVEDQATQVFSVALHRHLRGGEPPAAATRKAQLEMLQSPDPRQQAASAWAAYQVFGYQ